MGFSSWSHGMSPSYMRTPIADIIVSSTSALGLQPRVSSHRVGDFGWSLTELHDGLSKSRRMTSYMPNMMAALGTVLSR